MAGVQPFWLYNGDGSPNTTAVPTFLFYGTKDGASRPVIPAITNLGDGQRVFAPSDADELAGTIAVVQANDAGADPQYVTFTIVKSYARFFVFTVYDGTGALSTGAPTVGSYLNLLGAVLTPPAVVAVPGYAYLYTVTPTAADVLAGAFIRLDATGGTFPAALNDSAGPEAQPTAAPVIGGTIVSLLGVLENGAERSVGVPSNPRVGLNVIIGSTTTLRVRIVTPDGAAVSLAALTVSLTVKKRTTDSAAIAKVGSLVSGESVFSIAPADTKNLEAGMYAYDIWITEGNGTRSPVIPLSPWHLEAAATTLA